MTREELETLKSVYLRDIKPESNNEHQPSIYDAIEAAVALISRLPTFADGAPMVTPCDVWIVPGEWKWLDEMDGGEQPEMVTIWNFRHGSDGGHYCLSFDNSSDMNFGFGQVYQTEQAARESIK
jgi:hypothetical protein